MQYGIIGVVGKQVKIKFFKVHFYGSCTALYHRHILYLLDLHVYVMQGKNQIL